MKQTLKEKTFRLGGYLGVIFNRTALGKGYRLFYSIAVICFCCPFAAQAEQYYPRIEKPFLASNHQLKEIKRRVFRIEKTFRTRNHLSKSSDETIPLETIPLETIPLETVTMETAALETVTMETAALETTEDVRLTIREALYYSLQGNQDIQISSYIPQQAREDLLNAQSVYDPSFNLSGSHDRILDTESDIDTLTVDDETSFKMGVRQLLPSGGTLALFWETQRFDKSYDPFKFEERYSSAPGFEFKQPLLKNIGAKAEKAAIHIKNNNVKISEAEFQQTVNDIVAQVYQAYWRLYMHWEITDINQQTFDMAEEVHRREVARLADGIAKPLDVARAHSVAEARRTEILRSRERVQLITEQLKFLLNWADLKLDSSHFIIPVEVPRTEPVKITLAQAIKKGIENRPEIQKAKKNLDSASVRKDLSRHQQLPKLDAVMKYSVNGYGRQLSNSFNNIEFNDRNSWTVGLTLEMPIGNRSAKSVYRKQKLLHGQAGVAVHQLQNQIKLEIKQAFWAIEFAKEEIPSTLLEKTEAEKVVAGEFERFELGQMTNEELLRAQEFLANARRNYVQAVVKYNIALSELNRAQGILPHGLDIKGKKDKRNFIVSMTENKFLP